MRQIWFTLLLPATLLLVSLGLALAQEGTEVVDNLRQQWADLYNQGDIAGVAALYADNAVLYSASGQVAEGRQAIQESLQTDYDQGATSITIEPIETEVLGDSAHDIGSYSFTNAEGEIVGRGYYVAILEPVDGEWLIHRHLSNADLTMMQGPGMTGGGMTGGGGGRN